MNEDFKDWNIGLIAILIITTVIYTIGNTFTNFSLSLLESWGLSMIGITIFSGISAYKASNNAGISK